MSHKSGTKMPIYLEEEKEEVRKKILGAFRLLIRMVWTIPYGMDHTDWQSVCSYELVIRINHTDC